MKPIYFIWFCILILCSCKNNDQTFPENRIEYGMATLAVEFDDSIPDSLLNSPANLIISNSLSGSFTPMLLSAEEGQSRNRITDIPVLFTTGGSCFFETEANYVYVLFYLVPNEKTTVYFSMSDSGELVADLDMPLNMTSEEIFTLSEIVFNAHQHHTSNRSDFSEGMDGDVMYVENRVKTAQNNILMQDDLSDDTKDMAKIWVGLPIMNLYLEGLNYEIPPVTSLNFLKDFKLNDSRHLYNSYDYLLFINQLLYQYSTDLPPIGETHPEEWLEKADRIIGDWVSHEYGLFYDMLVAVNYARQLAIQSIPLSPAQIENIEGYFKNKSYVKVLLDENEKLIEHNKFNSQYGITTTSLPTPDVPLDMLMDAIIGQYPGQVVFVDFWATWCGPCMAGIASMKPVKENLADKDVVFVYITNETSSLAMFEKAVANIPGKHYRLTQDDMAYLLDYYFQDYFIPQYLIFDKAGNLAQAIKYKDFNPESIQQTIERLLNL